MGEDGNERKKKWEGKTFFQDRRDGGIEALSTVEKKTPKPGQRNLCATRTARVAE